MLKKTVFALVLVVSGILLGLVLLETGLRFFPVTDSFRALPVNEDNPVFRFTPDRECTWSQGATFAIVNRVRINNYGFVNDLDYDPGAQTPLMAVIGDSFIEAAMVPYEETLQGRLHQGVRDRGRVYSFAASGAPLSQYLVWADYAREEFAPDAYLFLVVSNDFDQSLEKYKHGLGFHHFFEDGRGGLELRRIDYEPSRIRDFARRFALARYLMINARLMSKVKFILRGEMGDAPGGFVGNVEARVPEERLNDARRAVQEFFDLLPGKTGVPRDRVLFVIDGIRQCIYDGACEEVSDCFWAEMRRYFIGECRKRGYEVIDMHPVFEDSFARRGQRFDYPTDAHWNGLAHGLAAEAAMDSRVYRETFAVSE